MTLTRDAAFDLLAAVLDRAMRDAAAGGGAGHSATPEAQRERANRERDRRYGLEHFADVLSKVEALRQTTNHKEYQQ